MRLLVAFCLASGPYMIWGWPSHWWLLASSFLAGAAGRRRSSSAASPSLGERIHAYTAAGEPAPPCEGCLDD